MPSGMKLKVATSKYSKCGRSCQSINDNLLSWPGWVGCGNRLSVESYESTEDTQLIPTHGVKRLRFAIIFDDNHRRGKFVVVNEAPEKLI